MNKKRKRTKYPKMTEEKAFVRDRGSTYGQNYRKIFCPECFNRLSKDLIHLRPGLMECRKCGTIFLSKD
jgi:hypothetical protein